jgi:dihydroorotase-like cyclic amidohydrolase
LEGRDDGAGRGAFVAGAEADLVVFDRSARWTVGADTLATKGFGQPLSGRSIRGQVLLTVAAGRLAYDSSETGSN